MGDTGCRASRGDRWGTPRWCRGSARSRRRCRPADDTRCPQERSAPHSRRWCHCTRRAHRTRPPVPRRMRSRRPRSVPGRGPRSRHRRRPGRRHRWPPRTRCRPEAASLLRTSGTRRCKSPTCCRRQRRPHKRCRQPRAHHPDTRTMRRRTSRTRHRCPPTGGTRSRWAPADLRGRLRLRMCTTPPGRTGPTEGDR